MKTKFLGSLFILLVLSCVVVTADSVWLVGQQEPVYGIVQSTDVNAVRFRRTVDGKKYELVSFDRNSIESIVTNFDSKRLEALVSGDWQSWYEYAEELMSQKKDPIARHLAMRLLVIVAGNASDANQRKSALTDLISLARNPDELKKLKQLRFLESGVREPEVQDVAKGKGPSLNDRKAAIQLVRAIRNGEEVNGLMRDARQQKTVKAFDSVCSWEELVQISKSNRIDNQQLRQLVALENQLRNGDTTEASRGTANESWHLLADRVEKSFLSLPTIGNVTEFDPSHTRFVDGKWSK